MLCAIEFCQRLNLYNSSLAFRIYYCITLAIFNPGLCVCVEGSQLCIHIHIIVRRTEWSKLPYLVVGAIMFLYQLCYYNLVWATCVHIKLQIAAMMIIKEVQRGLLFSLVLVGHTFGFWAIVELSYGNLNWFCMIENILRTTEQGLVERILEIFRWLLFMNNSLYN